MNIKHKGQTGMHRIYRVYIINTVKTNSHLRLKVHVRQQTTEIFFS